MKTIIKGEYEKGDINIILSNDTLNNDNFIDINIEDYEITVCIDELISALDGFQKTRILNYERDVRYTTLEK